MGKKKKGEREIKKSRLNVKWMMDAASVKRSQ